MKLADVLNFLRNWGLVSAGFVLLYGATSWDLSNTVWQKDEQAHGPIILAVVVWLLWSAGDRFAKAESRPRPVLGYALLVFGLLLYALGRSQEVMIFETGSMIPAVIGLVLLTRGTAALKVVWFPIVFMLFMVPVPGFVLDALTVPLKHYVSGIAEALLYAAGYPVARTGVVLSVGQYQLMVADACSGLNSMFALSAMGLLYLQMMGHKQWWRNLIVGLCILPIAFVANIVRVLILVLVTYHFGDEAGQGFIHEAAGMVLFMVALTLLFGLDSLLGLFGKWFGGRPSFGPGQPAVGS